MKKGRSYGRRWRARNGGGVGWRKIYIHKHIRSGPKDQISLSSSKLKVCSPFYAWGQGLHTLLGLTGVSHAAFLGRECLLWRWEGGLAGQVADRMDGGVVGLVGPVGNGWSRVRGTGGAR